MYMYVQCHHNDVILGTVVRGVNDAYIHVCTCTTGILGGCKRCQYDVHANFSLTASCVMLLCLSVVLPCLVFLSIS